ncbi:MAG TPA: hypothetical protein VGJ95_23550 [Pseudonocardiaceae bacterium]|jgi:hypothetical protein
MSDEDPAVDRDPVLDELAAMFDVLDPIPDHVVASAVAVPSIIAAWHDLDAGLLDVLADTALQPVPAGVRAGAGPSGGPRLVTFGFTADPEACSVEVEVGVEPSGTLRLIGLVVPTGPDELEVRHPGGRLRVPVDELGRFRVAGVPSGPLSLVLHGMGERATTTDWITV